MSLFSVHYVPDFHLSTFSRLALKSSIQMHQWKTNHLWKLSNSKVAELKRIWEKWKTVSVRQLKNLNLTPPVISDTHHLGNLISKSSDVHAQTVDDQEMMHWESGEQAWTYHKVTQIMVNMTARPATWHLSSHVCGTWTSALKLGLWHLSVLVGKHLHCWSNDIIITLYGSVPESCSWSSKTWWDKKFDPGYSIKFLESPWIDSCVSFYATFLNHLCKSW